MKGNCINLQNYAKFEQQKVGVHCIFERYMYTNIFL